MKKTNIDFLIKMTKSYLDGDIDSITYSLDFPYEVEMRYEEILKEDRVLGEIIYECLLEDGVDLYYDLTEEEFKEGILKEYNYVNGIYNEEVHII
ncbi:hypothetical protein [Dethiothermospora halolimnae]|uniref:hypothetical protein n=1 Tax=Dethiothermospora halolimnae TaxID=3114390 RepID=UPI003CCBE96D